VDCFERLSTLGETEGWAVPMVTLVATWHVVCCAFSALIFCQAEDAWNGFLLQHYLKGCHTYLFIVDQTWKLPLLQNRLHDDVDRDRNACNPLFRPRAQSYCPRDSLATFA
jgi:hypothetical protein